MKFFLSSAILIILISGCATKNAFSEFNLKDSEQKAIENTRCSKITSENVVGGIFSAVYLNNIYENMNKEHKMFYISIYIKENNNDFNVTLNNEAPIQIQKLPVLNKYSHLLPNKNEWTQNYLVTFKSTPNSDINLSIDSGQYSSGPLSYAKDQQ